MRFDILLYTSDEEYQCGTATRGVNDLTRAEVGKEIGAFEAEYRDYMANHNGHLIVGIVTHEDPPPADLMAGIYRAIPPVREHGMDYSEYVSMPLSYRLVELRFFDGDAPASELEDWLTDVVEVNFFSHAELFSVRDRAEFERKYRPRMLRPYTPSDLRRRRMRHRGQS